MSPLRRKMLDSMRQREFSARTQYSYIRAVEGLVRYCRRAPAQLKRGDIEAYFEHLVLKRELAPASCRLYLSGIRFLYVSVLGRRRFEVEVVLPKREQRIAKLLTRSEVQRLLSVCAHTKHHAILSTLYGCGLRVSEAVHLRVCDIDGERALAHIVLGKGDKDRQVILSPTLLAQLRDYWRVDRPSSWLFPGRSAGAALSVSSVQKVYGRAKACAGIDKAGGIHALRHAYATHQLAGGLPVHVLQRL